jgi:lipopolysaccharide/colanic/teichoic acid biosynthesis glycosyltransferase
VIKRLFDFIFSVTSLAVLAPVLVILYCFIRLSMGSPVMFYQVRPGMNEVQFKMFKFRSMTDALDSDGQPLPDAQRMTKLGSFLRSTSLDELPGLWNVLKGDMSLVGPRPLLMEYLPLYSALQARRHHVRPGLTGWAQVNGRNALSWEERFELDVWYVENQTFWLDIKILFLTIIKVFKRDGISQPGQATMTKFQGSQGE